MSDSPSSPPTPRPAPTIGSICRDLRQAAGVSRAQMEAQTGVAHRTIRDLETGRLLPTPDLIRRLLTAPALADLPALAKAAGLSLGLGDNGVSKS